MTVRKALSEHPDRLKSHRVRVHLKIGKLERRSKNLYQKSHSRLLLPKVLDSEQTVKFVTQVISVLTGLSFGFDNQTELPFC